MKVFSSASIVKGSVSIPPSKSHSIRAIFLASLAEGTSTLHGRLESADVDSAITACRSLGAEIIESGGKVTVNGISGRMVALNRFIDVGNSGTTARFLLSMASLSDKPITITGDASTRSRPMKPLLDALKSLGAEVSSAENGTLPATVCGPLKGGETVVDGTTSQYISSLLIHTPFAESDTTLLVASLNEKPYVDMTTEWLKRVGLVVNRDGYSSFKIPANQHLKSFEATIPADFSSSAFFLILSAIEGCEVELKGLDLNDTQGDKAVIDYLKSMGADIECGETIKIRGKKLKGMEIDLNATPDALPAMAVVGSLASGTTRLVNVAQARIKETDRIAVMASELKKMGVDIEEEDDGLIIKKSRLKGASLDGHNDHRIVMSLAVAGMAAEGPSVVSTAESIKITFPNFVELMKSCGANIRVE